MEMKKRSIIDFNMVSGVIANTMVFMDHPHVVKKATPFILMDSMGWDPHYYATLYVLGILPIKMTGWKPSRFSSIN